MVFWKKKKKEKKSNGHVDGAFLKGKEVGDEWDVGFRNIRHAGQQLIILADMVQWLRINL